MFDESRVLERFSSLSEDDLQSMNERMHQKTQEEYSRFEASYRNDECYLCGKPFSTISKDAPCLHWLLRRCKFKPKDIKLIYSKFGYTNVAAFLRWCANIEKPLVNINDITFEMKEGKIISNTIKWKNIERTFDCSESDFKGHPNSASDFPHYHFQMRIDGRQFINFNSYHLPFTREDIFALTMSRQYPDKFIYNFGEQGEGMGMAMELVGTDPDVLEDMTRTTDENEAVYHLSTTVLAAEGETISGDLLAELIEQSNKTGEPVSSLLHKHMSPSTVVRTYVSPSDNTPEITPRTEHKK
ncbi:hypothetical protein LRB91_01540 [Leclercia adecarboxylata]|uniref:hypothetical protein n=1 Tax=Leclercia adecarboxylata TaxID=83655 RepID=UPI0022B7BE9A|nr:hypothetical protein [Leclercia adecarboxylata]MCZ7837533.1 hypothetical protein [Leclercia adecarboxylata]